MQWVCYIEIQGLYAGVAQRAALAPPDRPVVVLRDGRVVDGCRMAFTAGLVLGAPARQALRDAPGAVAVDHALLDCGTAARAWWDECLRHTPYVEPLSPHQAYLALPVPGGALTAALRAEVNALAAAAGAHGFVAFVGVAPSKLVARAAALSARANWLCRRPGAAGRAAPPDTVLFVHSGEEARFLSPLPLEYLPAPPDVQRRLSRLGIRTFGEAARIPEGEWLRQLGPVGRQIHLWSRGEDREQVAAAYPPRSLTRRQALAPEVRDRDQLERIASRLAAALARELQGRGEGCQQAALTLEVAGRPEPVSQTRTLARLQQGLYPIQQALQTLLGQALAAAAPGGGGAGGAEAAGENPVAVTAVTAELGLIGPMPWHQMNLFDDSGRREREQRLESALLLLHERFPARIVGLGPRGGPSWREQMLEYADPYRWSSRTGGGS